MKKLLPKSVNNPSGFTLVELLVVISIIAVLSVIGIAVYTTIQPDARNAKRRADIDAIAKALEVNKTATGYVVLADDRFASGSIPTADPQGYLYCANSTASNQPSNPATWTTTCPANYGQVGTTNPPAGTLWKVCTSLETARGVTGAAYCRTNAQ